MNGLLRRARLWLHASDESLPAIPYEITCICGQMLQGSRQQRHQVVVCTGCGKSLFVLPISPYASPESLPLKANDPPSASLIPRPWRLPLGAAVVTLAGVIATYALILPHLGRDDSIDREIAAEQQLHAHLEAGRLALSEANFDRAVQEFDAAERLRDEHPGFLSLRETRRLTQLQREAALLDQLLHNSLQEIVDKAATERHEKQWQAQFRSNYFDRAVIIDDVVRREPDGRFTLTTYEVRVNDTLVRLEWGDLTLLQALPLERPQRLLFGARLANVVREPPGVWVVRFRPDSAVLLTNEDAIAASSPLPLDDELRQVLRRQAEWATSP